MRAILKPRVDGVVQPINPAVDILAPRWGQVADYGLNGENHCPDAPHAVHVWASTWDADWQAAHPGAWPLLVVTWNGIAADGRCDRTNTFQAVIAKNPAAPANAGNAHVEFRYLECDWASPTDNPVVDAVGGRSGVYFKNVNNLNLLGESGRFAINLDQTPGALGGLSGDPTRFAPYCLQSNKPEVMGPTGPVPLSGVFAFAFGPDGLVAYDADMDGVPEAQPGVPAVDNCEGRYNPRQGNLDGDDSGDACDFDTDEDDIPDAAEPACKRACSGVTDLDDDGFDNNCDNDADGDGIDDLFAQSGSWYLIDNCPQVPNADQADENRDGIGDACVGLNDENQLSSFGAPVEMEVNGELKPVLRIAHQNLVWTQPPVDAWQRPYLNCDELDFDDESDFDGDRAEHFDGDSDNCPFDFNPLQLDQDEDGQGNRCDKDIDGDGFFNRLHSDPDFGTVPDPDKPLSYVFDNCPWEANPRQWDFDQDGIGDACETELADTVLGFLLIIIDQVAWMEKLQAGPGHEMDYGLLYEVMAAKTGLSYSVVKDRVGLVLANWDPDKIWLLDFLEAELEGL